MAVQESLAINTVDYFDVMIIGHTGQGKSTLTDKLLIANPDGKKYTVDFDLSNIRPERSTLNCEDLSLWTVDIDKMGTRFKSLLFARTQEKPHEMINQVRKSEGSEKTTTADCEVSANDTTKVRVLDVPGFFDQGSLSPSSPISPTASSQTRRLSHSQAHSNAAESNLAIMRKIIHIQTTMGMKFKRILYFLPVRGPLERPDAVIQLEIKDLTHYFGLSVLKKLVLIATNTPKQSRKGESDEVAFDKDEREETMRNFMQCLKLLFPGEEKEYPTSFPLIYISLSETCESILKKIQDVQVDDEEDIDLRFSSDVCVSCGKKVGYIDGEKVVCYLGEADKVSYDESTCHPLFIPDFKWWQKIAMRLTRFFRSEERAKALATRWNINEICVNCEGTPNAASCLRVNTSFKYKGQNIVTDHKFNVPERDMFSQPGNEEVEEQTNPTAATDQANGQADP